MYKNNFFNSNKRYHCKF